jgi:hypothetical protein
MEVCGKTIRVDGKVIRLGLVEPEGYEFLADPEVGIRMIRESQTRVDIFTFVQKLDDLTPKYRYQMEWDNIAALQVSTFDEWMTKQVDTKVRNKIRKAAKNGVTVREAALDEAFIHGIHAIYNESPIRQGKPFWHYGKDLNAVRNMNSNFAGRSIYLGAYFEESLIGFIRLVSDEEWRQVGLMQIVSMISHQDKAPTNALLAQAVRTCADRGIKHLWYANMSYGTKTVDGLAEFKRHNGFQRVDLPRYYVPLTAAGRLALRIGLHRGVSEWIPEPVAATYRKIRKQWYGRAYNVAAPTEISR